MNFKQVPIQNLQSGNKADQFSANAHCAEKLTQIRCLASQTLARTRQKAALESAIKIEINLELVLIRLGLGYDLGPTAI